MARILSSDSLGFGDKLARALGGDRAVGGPARGWSLNKGSGTGGGGSGRITEIGGLSRYDPATSFVRVDAPEVSGSCDASRVYGNLRIYRWRVRGCLRDKKKGELRLAFTIDSAGRPRKYIR